MRIGVVCHDEKHYGTGKPVNWRQGCLFTHPCCFVNLAAGLCEHFDFVHTHPCYFVNLAVAQPCRSRPLLPAHHSTFLFHDHHIPQHTSPQHERDDLSKPQQTARILSYVRGAECYKTVPRRARDNIYEQSYLYPLHCKSGASLGCRSDHYYALHCPNHSRADIPHLQIPLYVML